MNNAQEYRDHLKNLIKRGSNFKTELGQIHYSVEFKVGSETIKYEQCMNNEVYESTTHGKTKFKVDNQPFWKVIDSLVTSRKHHIIDYPNEESFLSL